MVWRCLHLKPKHVRWNPYASSSSVPLWYTHKAVYTLFCTLSSCRRKYERCSISTTNTLVRLLNLGEAKGNHNQTTGRVMAPLEKSSWLKSCTKWCTGFSNYTVTHNFWKKCALVYRICYSRHVSLMGGLTGKKKPTGIEIAPSGIHPPQPISPTVVRKKQYSRQVFCRFLVTSSDRCIRTRLRIGSGKVCLSCLRCYYFL